MDQDDPNREMMALAALELEPFLEDFVFVGGAAVGLLVTETGLGRIRVTKDVDVIVEIAGRTEFHRLESRLRASGLQPDTSDNAPICRWRANGLMIDIMPTDENIFGFSNHWYSLAVETAQTVALRDGLHIRLVSPACFLATKMEAFLERGMGDFLASHDFEDIVTVINGRREIVEELRAAPGELNAYVSSMLTEMSRSTDFTIAVEGIVAPRNVDRPRLDAWFSRLHAICR